MTVEGGENRDYRDVRMPPRDLGEVDLLRTVVRELARTTPPSSLAWMQHSPADEAYRRAFAEVGMEPPPLVRPVLDRPVLLDLIDTADCGLAGEMSPSVALECVRSWLKRALDR